jgi:hypothetical protein
MTHPFRIAAVATALIVGTGMWLLSHRAYAALPTECIAEDRQAARAPALETHEHDLFMTDG